MNREELKEATDRFLKGGGKIEKLPDGPNFNFQRYTVRVPKSNGLDLTAMEDPSTKKQRKAFESGAL